MAVRTGDRVLTRITCFLYAEFLRMGNGSETFGPSGTLKTS